MKVRITDTTFSIPVGESINGKTFDAEKEGNLYTISAQALASINPDAFDKTHGKYHFYPRELEVINETEYTTFKVGDKVRFKKEFYKEEYFKKLPRNTRTIVAELARQGSFDVYYTGAERVHIASNLSYCYDIDASLLEIVEPIVKEVNRVAKVGEWIKIVAEENAKGLYKNGDILKVNSLVCGFCITVDGFERGIYHREYVVLEGYEPTPKLEVKEVSRKAEVGEYIKIVNSFMAFGDYKEGDIFKVKEKYGRDSVQVFGTFDTYICKSEYVVLENYKPEEKPSATPKKEPKKIAKVGDFIKIKEWSGGDKMGTIAEVVGIGCGNRVEYKSSNSPYGTYFSSFYEIVEPPKRKWTPEEIVKAKCFLAEELIYAKCRFVYDHNSNRTACYNFETGRSAEAKCAPNDEFNQYIGAVVAYCKTCGVKIPEFIKH